ncbi:hypothetical protein SBDP1_810012 [Syntrophobacter sp. SbD1]|nr:hypothetical protein SBDP1_810012 [Syntrophobacter sp. SbD1]
MYCYYYSRLAAEYEAGAAEISRVNRDLDGVVGD